MLSGHHLLSPFTCCFHRFLEVHSQRFSATRTPKSHNHSYPHYSLSNSWANGSLITHITFTDSLQSRDSWPLRLGERFLKNRTSKDAWDNAWKFQTVRKKHGNEKNGNVRGEVRVNFLALFALKPPHFYVQCPQIVRNCSRDLSLEHCHCHAFFGPESLTTFFQTSAAFWPRPARIRPKNGPN